MSNNAYPQLAYLPAAAVEMFDKSRRQADGGNETTLQAFKDLGAMFVAAQKLFTQGLADGVDVSELSMLVGVRGPLSQFEEAYALLKFVEAPLHEKTPVLRRVCLRNLTISFEMWAASRGFTVIQRRPLLHAGYFEMALAPLAPAGN